MISLVGSEILFRLIYRLYQKLSSIFVSRRSNRKEILKDSIYDTKFSYNSQPDMFDQPILIRLPQSSFKLNPELKDFSSCFAQVRVPPSWQRFFWYVFRIQLGEITWHDVPIVYAANFRLFSKGNWSWWIQSYPDSGTKKLVSPSLANVQPTLAEKTGIIQTPVFLHVLEVRYNTSLPSWKLTYPLPRHFWIWFSFSHGGKYVKHPWRVPI